MVPRMCHPVEMGARLSEVFKIACPALPKVTANENVATIVKVPDACPPPCSKSRWKPSKGLPVT